MRFTSVKLIILREHNHSLNSKMHRVRKQASMGALLLADKSSEVISMDSSMTTVFATYFWMLLAVSINCHQPPM
jgi:hypothetical protein